MVPNLDSSLMEESPKRITVIKAKFNKIVPNFGSVVVFPIYWDFSALKIPISVF